MVKGQDYELTAYCWRPQANTSLVYVRYSRSAVLSIMILMYLIGAQGPLLSQISVGLNITVTLR